ncbi:hypothetical protein LTR84_004362 [Exophiala bonariae]|uniref:Isoleucine--tRNA ligase, mitochondrial n=1 Tax=Exophiala bonariae TaxID=1690606 RepID=A0AAV9N5P5_9EURO|nr:hypothetical protein LTR84_004362 [Exophiala bonariae]
MPQVKKNKFHQLNRHLHVPFRFDDIFRLERASKVASGVMNQAAKDAAKDAAKYLKSTLRLPSSKFPPRPPPADLARLLPKCTDELYAWQRQERPASNPFVLHDGPPYANGDLHVGHALNKIVKDIICRSKLAEGKRISYTPGWDCHGLPIELKALEASGWERGQGIDPVKIRKAARKFAYKAVEKQMAGFRSWGVMGDWANHWTTMQRDFELRQLAVFQAMAEHGLIYRKNKPVYWSPSSGTALAEAELEYQEDHVSTAAFVKFRLAAAIPGVEGPVYLLIWTTTPWTVPANQAIAIHEGLDYSLIRSPSNGLLVVASSRIEYMKSILSEHLDVVSERVSPDLLLKATYSGLAAFGSDAENRPIIHADFVSAESGTGLVHCAPGHGMEDYEALQPWIRSGVVTVKAPVDNGGRFDENASPLDPTVLKGQEVFKVGNQTVLDLLAANKVLAHSHSFKHKYPIDWRTKEPVMIRATAQWFTDISKIKSDTLQALEPVKFVPESGRSRLRAFVENRSEWCISRQRSWGVPIPAIYHKTTGEAVIDRGSIQHIISTIKDRGIDAWWSDAPDDPAWIAPGLNPADYVRGADTMDVWFDSGTSWTSMLDPSSPPTKPLADVNVEGTDQHRGWFQSSLLTHIAYQKSMYPDATNSYAPFQTLATHGFTLDAQGKKMSKSLGNVIAPMEIILGMNSGPKVVASKSSKKPREYHPLGPDALRLWVASSDWTKDVVISETVVKTIHASLDKYRVTMKLLLGLLEDFTLDKAVPYEDLSFFDQVALLQLHRVSSTVQKAYPSFEFHRAVTAINRWVATDLSGFYFEGIKDVLYCDSPTSARRRSAQTTLHYILSHFQEMLAPVAPLLVEESWAHTPEEYKSKLEHPLKRIWAEPPLEWQNQGLSDLLPSIIAINTGVKAAQEKARSEKLMGQSLASDVVVYLQPEIDVSQIPDESWKEMFVVSGVEVVRDNEFRTLSEAADKTSGAQWAHSSHIELPVDNVVGTAVVRSPDGKRCARCWKYVVKSAVSTPTVAEVVPSDDAGKPGLPLCGRCTNTVAEFEK